MNSRIYALNAKLADQKTRIATLTADRTAGKWIDSSKLEYHIKQAQLLELQINELMSDRDDEDEQEQYDEDADRDAADAAASEQADSRSDLQIVRDVFEEEVSCIAKGIIGYSLVTPVSTSFRGVLQEIIEDGIPQDRPDLRAQVAEKLLSLEPLISRPEWHETVKIAMTPFLQRSST